MLLLKKRYWLVIILLLSLLFIIRLIPAQWLIYSLQQRAVSFQASDISGTLWQGRADYSQWSERGHVWPLGQLQWRINIPSLMTLRPCLYLSSDVGSQQLKGMACYSILSGKVSAQDINIQLAIANIAPFFGLALLGNINAFIKNIELNKTGFTHVDGQLLWQQASVFNGNEWLAAGNIQAKIGDNNGQLISQWQHISEDQPAPLELNVSVKAIDIWAKKPTIKVEGTIKPRAPRSGFNPILQFIGNKNNNGTYRIDLTK